MRFSTVDRAQRWLEPRWLWPLHNIRGVGQGSGTRSLGTRMELGALQQARGGRKVEKRSALFAASRTILTTAEGPARAL